MPRSGRLHVEGGYYHVLGRGIERRNIFEQTQDKTDFLNRLGIALEKTDIQCLSWALMSNHYHLLLRVREQPLSQLMSSVLGGYGRCYNRRHVRSGYVFQNRFTSILCDADSYLLELIRYIHLNPVKAGIVKSIAELGGYRWTGHAGVTGRYRQPWHQCDLILALFGNRTSDAMLRYCQFVEEGLHLEKDPELSGGGLVRSYGGWENVTNMRKEHVSRIGDERILGDSDFVTRMLSKDNLRLTSQAAFEEQGLHFEELIEGVCNYCDIGKSELTKKGRANALSLAKSLICYWGSVSMGVSTTLISNTLQISQPSISKSVHRGRAYCEEKKLNLEDIFSGLK